MKLFLFIDDSLYRYFTNTKYLFWTLIVVFASLMLWHPAEIYFTEPVNLFLTKKDTYEQLPKWYVFFTQGFIERAVLTMALYYNLKRFYKNTHCLFPFVVYNVWRIFEYWLFAFSVDRYVLILVMSLISIALYGRSKPTKRYT